MLETKHTPIMSFFKKAFKTEQKQADTRGWKSLNSLEGLQGIIEKSAEKPQVIFKHSTRCSISAMAKMRLERNWDFDESQVDMHYLDLIRYRTISNEIADTFGVVHESPQVLVIKNGQSVFDTSHNAISTDVIKNAL